MQRLRGCWRYSWVCEEETEWQHQDGPQLLWSDESKPEIFGSRRTFVHQKAAEQKIMKVCKRWRIPKGLGWISANLEIWSLLKLS